MQKLLPYLYIIIYFNVNGLSAQNNSSYKENTSFIKGSNNVAFGAGSQFQNDPISHDNASIGYQALAGNNTGINNIAIGSRALANNYGGAYNIANGVEALFSNDNGSYNVAIGLSSLKYNVNGSYNVANGAMALYNNTSGFNNIANGYFSLALNKKGNNNIANGYQSLFSNDIGNNNVGHGYQTLYSNQLGSNNIALGYQAGYYETGNNKLYIAADSNKTIIYGDMSTGQVLLGKKQPNGYVFKGTRTLNVIGGVLADSMRVTLSGKWADYVFEENYKLRNLDELEGYIKENKHLPNIPSSQEVSQNGIDLAAMNAKLLEKIEELHLYVLQLKNDYREIKAVCDQMKKAMLIKK